MIRVCYGHFIVEHYRGHYPRAAAQADPASARYGKSLNRFLPRSMWAVWPAATLLAQPAGLEFCVIFYAVCASISLFTYASSY